MKGSRCISSETVAEYSDMLRKAIRWFEEDAKQKDPVARLVLNDMVPSRLSEIKDAIRAREMIRPGEAVDLIYGIVEDYEGYLKQAGTKKYLNGDAIRNRLEATRCFKDEVGP
jgi:hypothetical protein